MFHIPIDEMQHFNQWKRIIYLKYLNGISTIAFLTQ